MIRTHPRPLGGVPCVHLSRGDGPLLPARRLRRRTHTGRAHWAPAIQRCTTFSPTPANAGAFVFGRTRTEERIDQSGTVARIVLLPRERWTVLISDHHPGFMDWASYEANTKRLRQNWPAARGESPCVVGFGQSVSLPGREGHRQGVRVFRIRHGLVVSGRAVVRRRRA